MYTALCKQNVKKRYGSNLIAENISINQSEHKQMKLMSTNHDSVSLRVKTSHCVEQCVYKQGPVTLFSACNHLLYINDGNLYILHFARPRAIHIQIKHSLNIIPTLPMCERSVRATPLWEYTDHRWQLHNTPIKSTLSEDILVAMQLLGGSGDATQCYYS